MRTQSKLVIATLAVSSMFLLGCEDDAVNKIAKAQDCLNKISDANTSDAQNCINIVEGLSSQESYVIRCSAEFLKGGLTTTRVSKSLESLNNTGGSKNEAAFMGLLALKSGGNEDNLLTYCQNSNVPGLVYMGTMSYTGTKMAKAAGISDGDMDNSNFPTTTQVNNMISNCDGDAAACNNEETGQAVFLMSQTYCTGNKKDDPVCQKTDQALASAGGADNPNYATFMDNLLTELNN